MVKPAQSSLRPSELHVVCDTMLTGLGRQLRCCGVDVRLVDADTSHDTAAMVCLSLISDVNNKNWDKGSLGLLSFGVLNEDNVMGSSGNSWIVVTKLHHQRLLATLYSTGVQW